MTQTRNSIFTDISQLMTNAMGVAQGARTEAETAMKGWMDRWIADRNLVTREEHEAVRAMAVKAREQNEALAARIAVLEAAFASTSGASMSASASGASFPSSAPDAATQDVPEGLSVADMESGPDVGVEMSDEPLPGTGPDTLR